MKTITLYDLLGLVKDGKAPKKIKYMGYIFEYDTNHKRYESYFDEQIWTLNDFVNVDDNLNEPVEILEEEKKIPEKLENEKKFYAYTRYEENKDEIDKVLYILKAINLTEEKIDNLNNSVNEIIDFLKSKEEKEIPEKLEYEESDENGEFSINGVTFDFEQKIQIIKTVNEIIDYLKSKGE